MCNKNLERIRKEMEKFEDGFPDGVYVVPSHTKGPRIKVKALSDYCEKKGVEPEDLTEEERKQFIDYPKY